MAAKQRFPWVSVSAVAAVVVVVAVAWLQLPADYPRMPAAFPLPSFGLARIDAGSSAELLAEQLAAYDPTPMFIPSPMSSNAPALPEGVQAGATGPFAVLPVQLTKTSPLVFPPAVTVPSNTRDALRLTERVDAPLAMARADVPADPLAPRLAYVEAIAAGSGQVVLSLSLPHIAGTAVAGVGGLAGGDWQPMELLGAVSPAGLVGELVVTGSSGSDEVDDYFRSHLRRNVRIGARLSAGFYAFHVGP